MTEAEGVTALKAAGVDTAVRDAQILWSAAGRDAGTFASFIARRGQEREPVSRILRRRAFWDHEFLVTRDVLDPRPDTETLVDAACGIGFETVLDLGTGSGCILLSLLACKPAATGVGTDISAAALKVAAQNAERLHVAKRTRLLESDWFSNVEGRFDLIVSNPPYITAEAFDALQPEVRNFDPKIALTPGGDGLAAYRVITQGAPQHLTPGGALMVEIGFDQGQAVRALFGQAGFTDIAVLPDINGKDRVVKAVLR